MSEIKAALDEFQQDLREFKSTITADVKKALKLGDDAHAEIEKLGVTGFSSKGGDAPWLDVKSLITGNDTQGGYFVAPEQWGSFVDRLRPSSVLLASGVPTIRTSAQSLNMPTVTGDPTASWRGELETLSGTNEGSYGLVRATPRKVAAYVVSSRELLEDSSPEIARVLEGQISASLALALDAAAFGSPSVNANAAPLAFKDTVGIQSQPVADNGAVPTTFAWFHAAFGAYIEAHANPSTAALYMHPRDWSKLMLIPVETGSNVPALFNMTSTTAGPTRSVFGVPVYLTSQIPTTEVQGSSGAVCSSAYLVDTSQIALVVRQDTRIELDRSRHFDTDGIGIRGTMRADIAVLNSAAVVRIPGFKVS
jgi:HK97 family phage major capsid protein